MARITSTTNSNLLNTEFFAARFIERLESETMLIALAKKEDAAHSSGKTIRWQYFANPTAATTALSEGGDPPVSTNVSTTSITATMSEYGAYFEPAKFFISTAASGTKAEIVDIAGYQAALTLDTLCYTQALNDTTNAVTPAAMTAEILRIGVLALKDGNAKPHPNTPGGRYYCGVMAPEDLFDMMGESTNYGGAQAPTWQMAKTTDLGMPGAIGIPGEGEQNATLYGVWIKTTTNVSNSTSGRNDAYILAKDAFGAVSMDSNLMAPRVIITDPEQRVDKPLRNSGTVGWWVCFAAELFDSNRCYEISNTNT